MKTGSKERDLFLKLCRYCAYRERAISEVRKKMVSLEISSSLQNKLLHHLQEENFLNEKRFAVSYAGGKFRNNAWGRRKIVKGLLEKKINSDIIDFALNTLDTILYQEKLVQLIHKKKRDYKAKNVLVLRKKIADYLGGKGYELGLVWELLKQELPD